jgi:serine/threonine protein kinase/tetratricopeptide (TPR) repeat protein
VSSATERRLQIESAFEQALELPEHLQSAWLSATHGSDLELVAEVRALLEAHRAAGILDSPVVRSGPDPEPADRRVGPYRLLRELGRGGMGVVYLAERDDGQFRKRVAVKILRGSPDAEELHTRFLAERQILASLNHPNIAQLLDGGVTDGRLPYLVMEYVDGVPITDYCDAHRLGIRARLALFRHVCDAVSHAHQNLIIHRDLKPSNITVTRDGRVKLLDFGIAKLLNPDLGAFATPVTRAHHRVMTPEYASPEQIRGDPLTTASDVYSLGIVLYQVLTGHSPYNLTRRSAHEIVEAVCERDPDRPSTKITRTHRLTFEDGSSREINPEAVSATRGASIERLRRQLRGDVDAIVMMAIRKEPARRYHSTDALRRDIDRYLDELPVTAHQGSRWYRVRKQLVRHRFQVAATAVVAGSLLAGAGVATWQAAVARSERDRAQAALLTAEQSLRQTEEVTDFLVDLFEASDPAESAGDTVTARDLLNRGLNRVDALSTEPAVQARVLGAIGRVHRSLGDYERAGPLLERSLALRRAALGPEHVEVAESMQELGTLLRLRGTYPAAESLYLSSLAMQRRVAPADEIRTAATLSELAALQHTMGRYAAADSLYREVYGIRLARLGGEHSRTIATLDQIAVVTRDMGKRDSAGVILNNVLQIRERVLGADHPDVATTLSQLATIHAGRGEWKETEALLRRALRIRERAFGADHPEVARTMGMVASSLTFQGRLDEAETMHRQSLGVLRRTIGPDHTTIAAALNSLGLVLKDKGQLAEAEVLFRESVAMYRRVFRSDHAHLATSLRNLATVRARRGDAVGAESLFVQSLEMRRRMLGPRHSFVATSMGDLARFKRDQRRFAEAEALYLELLTTFADTLGSGHHEIRRAHTDLAALYRSWGQPAKAEEHARLSSGP